MRLYYLKMSCNGFHSLKSSLWASPKQRGFNYDFIAVNIIREAHFKFQLNSNKN